VLVAEMASGSPRTLVLRGPRSQASPALVSPFLCCLGCLQKLFPICRGFQGTFVPDSSDTSGYNSDIIGLAWVTFDPSSGSSGSATPRIFVGVVSKGEDNVFVSEDAGNTCKLGTELIAPSQTINTFYRVCDTRTKHNLSSSQRSSFPRQQLALHYV
jgi:hypothetical protein